MYMDKRVLGGSKDEGLWPVRQVYDLADTGEGGIGMEMFFEKEACTLYIKSIIHMM